jgi:membrane fusion protein (multidrug efflux system)
MNEVAGKVGFQADSGKTPPPNAANASNHTLRHRLRRSGISLAISAAVIGAGYLGYRYFTVGQYMVSTDDAYVQADYSTIAPKISGYIRSVSVYDNEKIKAGQLLATIDQRDYLTAVAQAESDLEAAQAAIANVDTQIVLQRSLISQAAATVAATQASLAFDSVDAARYGSLVASGASTLQRSQQAASLRAETAARLQSDIAAQSASRQKVQVLDTQRVQAIAERDHASAVLQQTKLNLSYTRITAPIAGVVGERTLRLGDYVTIGTQLMAIVPLSTAYVVANYKETQLTHVRPGQPVTVEVDSFPNINFKGHVDSVAPASGLEFAFLPPDNATGNFTKIVQRIPVKIIITQPQDISMLSAGMSVESSIDTRPTR